MVFELRRMTSQAGFMGAAIILPMVFTGAPKQVMAATPGASSPTTGRAAPMSSQSSPARSAAAFDATGHWVSLVTEDWRFRMVVPGQGEYSGIPINAKGKAFADSWSRAADEAAGKQCEAYAAGIIMQAPGRLDINWQDDNTLRVRTDAGMQTRLLYFSPSAQDASAASSWQGFSVAHWVFHKVFVPTSEDKPFQAPSGESAPRRYGQLEVITNKMLPGLLRKNGVPYGADSRMTEYWEQHADTGGLEKLLIITTELVDPEYLQTPYDYTAIFKDEADGSKWNPTVCSLSN